MKIARFVFVLVGLFSFVVAYSSADVAHVTVDDSQLEFVDVQNIEELLTANITPPFVDGVDDVDLRRTTLSPDGNTIIFYRRNRQHLTAMVCEYRFSSNSTTCVAGDEELPDFFGGFWSPDSRYVVLNSDIATLQFARESDLTIYDTQTDTITYRTDDGVSSRERIFEDDVRNRIWIDTAPIFAPNGDLYFFRNAIDPTLDEWRADLMRVAASDIIGTSAPEVVWRHPTTGSFSIFRTDGWYLDGAMSISPDGNYLAIASFNLANLGDTTNGIWVFDIAQKSVKTHIPVSRLGEAIDGIPTWVTQGISETGLRGIFPNSLAWANDNNTLVIWTRNDASYSEFFIPTIKYDVTTDTLSSFYDFTNLSKDDYKPTTTLFDDVSLFVDIYPTAMVMSPSYQTAFYIGRDNTTNTWILSAMSVIESGFTTPRRIANLTDYAPERTFVINVGYTAPTLRILTGEYLITLTKE